MTATQVLTEALEVIKRDHTSVQLAVTARGQKCRPLDPDAVSWSSVGAICKVAPGRSVHDDTCWADHTEAGWEAFLLLCDAARQQGYRDLLDLGCVAMVDAAGESPAWTMFARALQLAPDRRKHRPRAGAGSGSSPRGVEAA